MTGKTNPICLSTKHKLYNFTICDSFLLSLCVVFFLQRLFSFVVVFCLFFEHVFCFCFLNYFFLYSLQRLENVQKYTVKTVKILYDTYKRRSI